MTKKPEEKTLEEWKKQIADEIKAPFPWKFDVDKVAIVGSNGEDCHDYWVWLYIQALERENTELKKCARTLSALRSAGVDNWEGYDDAMDSLEEEDCGK